MHQGLDISKKLQIREIKATYNKGPVSRLG